VTVYRLNYLQPDRAVTALKAILPALIVTPAPEPVAPPAGVLNTIVGGFQSSSGGGGSGGGSAGGSAGGGAGGASGTGGAAPRRSAARPA